MANFEIEGRLLQKYDTKIEFQSFQTREFVVETQELAYPNYIKLQLTEERCSLLDSFEEGEWIKVVFNLRGKEVQGKYFTKLEALRIAGFKSVFKYQSDFNRLNLQECPPKHYREFKMTIYRYVFQNLSHTNNFLPVGLINPSRINSEKDSASKCQMLGLSLFQEKVGARDRFQRQMAKNERFAKLVGDHLATLEVERNDGVGSLSSAQNFSHFTFHEYVTADLASKISNIEKI